MIGRLIAALVAFVVPAAADVRAPIEILVPAYFYPHAGHGDWDRLAGAARQGISVTAIMNPATGPGDASDANYARALAAFRTAGGRVLGYVPTGYAGRRIEATSSCRPADGRQYTIEDMTACAHRYREFYAVDGIFLDELGGEALGATWDEVDDFYTSLYKTLKKLERTWRIVGNPGTRGLEHLLSRGADALVTFEGYAADFQDHLNHMKRSPRPSGNLGALLIAADPSFDVGATLSLAAERNTSLFFATDRGLPNPYDGLPANFDAQVAAIREFNAVRGR